MATPLKYALIGCGRIACEHINAAQSCAEDIRLVALCDLDEQKARQTLALLPEDARARVHIYTDHKALLSREKPDLVAVAVWSGAHAAIAMDCLRAGCHVIVEKPIALSMDDAEALIAEADARGLRLCACHQNRYNKAIQCMRQAVDAGRFGSLRQGAAHIFWGRDKTYYQQAAWRGTWAQDGGTLMNQCIHAVDLLRWLMGGRVTEVTAQIDRLYHPYIEAEDAGMALVRFEGGAHAMIHGTANVSGGDLEETIYLLGERGTAKAGGMCANKLELWRFADGLDDQDDVLARFREAPATVYGFGHIPLYRDMIAAIREGRAPYVDGRAGRDGLELVFAMYKSALEGRPVSLPLGSFSTAAMIGYFDKNHSPS